MTDLDSSCQAQDYSSLDPTVVSAQYDATLELGKELVRELGLGQSVDTLGRWMAHHIAELMQDAENSDTDDRSSKMHVCSEAIYALWSHQHELPNGKKPFESLEPIKRALESLDPEDQTPRYFRAARSAYDERQNKNSEATTWLKMADGFDYSAKLLIRYCLAEAAKTAIEKSEKWVVLADKAGAEENIEITIVRTLYDEHMRLEESSPGEENSKKIQERIQRLDAFIEMANAMSLQLKDTLKDSSE
ncbi:MAG TPA: AVAST type 3 anti-phage protein Avs3b [Cellvibrio sp.]|nr:AVAST type 3 anti-phage protein Avs3b [Cellvibrio sp.]